MHRASHSNAARLRRPPAPQQYALAAIQNSLPPQQPCPLRCRGAAQVQHLFLQMAVGGGERAAAAGSAAAAAWCAGIAAACGALCARLPSPPPELAHASASTRKVAGGTWFSSAARRAGAAWLLLAAGGARVAQRAAAAAVGAEGRKIPRPARQERAGRRLGRARTEWIGWERELGMLERVSGLVSCN